MYYVSEAVAGRPLDHASNPFYDLNIVCTDAGGATGTPKTYTINVVDNETPTFTNVAGKLFYEANNGVEWCDRLTGLN